jgi:hypothetical protein
LSGEVVGRGPTERDNWHPGDAGINEVGKEPVVAERYVRMGDVADGRYLSGPQHRHGRDGDRTGLDHTEEASHQPRVVRPAQKDPVSGHDVVVLDECARDLIRTLDQVAIRP